MEKIKSFCNRNKGLLILLAIFALLAATNQDRINDWRNAASTLFFNGFGDTGYYFVPQKTASGFSLRVVREEHCDFDKRTNATSDMQQIIDDLRGDLENQINNYYIDSSDEQVDVVVNAMITLVTYQQAIGRNNLEYSNDCEGKYNDQMHSEDIDWAGIILAGVKAGIDRNPTNSTELYNDLWNAHWPIFRNATISGRYTYNIENHEFLRDKVRQLLDNNRSGYEGSNNINRNISRGIKKEDFYYFGSKNSAINDYTTFFIPSVAQYENYSNDDPKKLSDLTNKSLLSETSTVSKLEDLANDIDAFLDQKDDTDSSTGVDTIANPGFVERITQAADEKDAEQNAGIDCNTQSCPEANSVEMCTPPTTDQSDDTIIEPPTPDQMEDVPEKIKNILKKVDRTEVVCAEILEIYYGKYLNFFSWVKSDPIYSDFLPESDWVEKTNLPKWLRSLESVEPSSSWNNEIKFVNSFLTKVAEAVSLPTNVPRLLVYKIVCSEGIEPLPYVGAGGPKIPEEQFERASLVGAAKILLGQETGGNYEIILGIVDSEGEFEVQNMTCKFGEEGEKLISPEQPIEPDASDTLDPPTTSSISITPDTEALQITPRDLTTSTVSTCPTFTNNMFIGSRGTEVRELQKFLIKEGYFISDSATGYFGFQTRSALASYQKNNNISPAVGYFGPLTREAISSSCSSSNTSTTPQKPIIPETPNEPEDPVNVDPGYDRPNEPETPTAPETPDTPIDNPAETPNEPIIEEPAVEYKCEVYRILKREWMEVDCEGGLYESFPDQWKRSNIISTN